MFLIDAVHKIYARIINQCLQTIKHLILKEQNCYKKGRSCSDNAFIITQRIEKYRKFNKEKHIAFIDF